MIVTDAEGNPIRGLTAADFTVRENGKKVPISNFAGIAGRLDSPAGLTPAVAGQEDPMRTLVALVIGLGVAVGIAVLAFLSLDRPDGRGDAAAPIAAESDRAEIRERIRAMQDANNAGDVEAWVDGFAPDAVYMPPGLPAIATRAGLREIAESGFSSARTDVTLTPDEVEIAGDWAFARIRVEGVATVLADGRTIAIDMKELVVFRRQPDGSWKIARFMANRNAAS